MAMYNVLIVETLERVVEVDAPNKDAALEMVQDMYSKEEIVLDAGDFSDNAFSVMED